VRPYEWHVRRATLASLLRGRGVGHGIHLSDHMDTADGEAVFRHACAMGLEGIVAKRRDRPYRSRRTPDWIKVKNPDAPAATRPSSSCVVAVQRKVGDTLSHHAPPVAGLASMSKHRCNDSGDRY